MPKEKEFKGQKMGKAPEAPGFRWKIIKKGR